MMTMVSPKFEFVCDRCGTTRLVTEQDKLDIHDVRFCTDIIDVKKAHTQGQVCKKCYEDFIVIAENFFDESNFQ